MCHPCILNEVDRVIADRRRFLKSAAGGCAAAVGLSATAPAAALAPPRPTTFSRVIDLTHTLSPDFPAWFKEGQDILGRTAPPTLVEVDEFEVTPDTPFALKRVSYWEHVGTHVDAANHFSLGKSVDEIPASELVAPLAVIDIRDEAARDPLAQVTPEHVRKWEARHGELPEGAFVAMMSGWSEKAGNREQFMPVDESVEGPFNWKQPAFHPDTARMLLEDRDVVGIGVDTLSFDNLRSNVMDVHLIWLPADRWGVENLTDLSKVPAAGATIVVGAPKFKGGTGGPARVLALA